MSVASDGKLKRVLVVLTNYKRPQNTLHVAWAFHGHYANSTDFKMKVVIVDNSPPCHEHIDPASHPANDRWQIYTNLGPPCRFAPAFMEAEHSDYIYFHDEDALPGSRLLAHYLRHAASLNDQFATLGQVGRRYQRPGKSIPMQRPANYSTLSPQDQAKVDYHCREKDLNWAYKPRNVKRLHNDFVKVDCTCRGHFVRADLMWHVLAGKWKLIEKHGMANCEAMGIGRHDDLLLCQGIQMGAGLPSYLTPKSVGVGEGNESCGSGREEYFEKMRLNDGGSAVAASGRVGHKQERTGMVRGFVGVGWESLV